MLQLKDAIDENILTIIKKILMQFVHSSVALYEADGTYVFGSCEGQYCEYLNMISYEKARASEFEPEKWICNEDCWKVSKEAIEKKEPVEMECTGGIRIYAVPIIYNDQVIGCIKAGITNPPLEKTKLETISSHFGIELGELLCRAYMFKRLTNEEMEMARLQLRMLAVLISSLYELKVKQISAEKELKNQKELLEVTLENMNDGVAIFNHEGNILLANAEARSRYPKLNNKSTIYTVHDNFEFADLEGNSLTYEKLPTRRVFNLEKIRNEKIKIKYPDKHRIIEVNAVPVMGVDNKLVSAVVSHHDITEMIENEKKTILQKELLQTIIDNTSEILLVYDSNGKLLIKNNEAKKVLGNFQDYNKIGDKLPGLKLYKENGQELTYEDNLTKRALNGETVNNIIISAYFSEKHYYLRCSAKPVYDIQNKIEYIVVSMSDITELIDKEKLISDQKKQLEVIIENIGDAVFILDRNMDYYMTNKAALEYFHGLKPWAMKEALEKFPFYDVHDNLISIQDFILTKVFRGETVINDKIKIKDSFSTKFVSVNGRPIYNNQGEIDFVVLSSRDITNDISSQRIIESQNQLLLRQANMLNLSNEAIMSWDYDGTLIYWNKGAEKMYGYNSEEAVGENIHELLHTKYPDIAMQFLTLEDSINWHGEIEHMTKSGKKLVIDTFQQIIENDSPNKIILEINRDVTARKIMQEKLIAQKEQLSAILENMIEGVVIADPEGEIICMNASSLQIHGINPNNSISNLKDFMYKFELFDLDDRLIPFEEWPLSKVINGETFVIYEAWLRNKETNIKRLCNYTGKPIYDLQGKLKLVIITLRDITVQKEHEQLLMKAELQKNEVLENSIKMKDEFISLISHEFKTPLTVINSAIQAMEFICRNELSEKGKSFLNKIRQNSFRQLRLVNNLLDITRINAGKIKINKKNLDIVFITNSITESVYLYASQKGVRITFSSSFKCKIIGIDEEKYERIILNLLSNAIKFTPSGGTIIVSLRSKNGWICVEVKDTGLGIPKDKVNLIFERFGQVDSSLSRQAEGTGIGLSLVKLMVEALGGSITLKSTVGKGSNFIILLPSDKVEINNMGNSLKELSENRLIQATAVEFSDIYL